MSKKKTKSALPKRIAGVKVPKAVRKGRVGELLTSKAGQAAIAEVLMAVAAVAGARKAKDSPAARGIMRDAADAMKGAGKGKGRDVSAVTATLTYALGEAVRAFADALREDRGRSSTTPDPQSQWRPAANGPLNGPEPEKKSPESYEAGPL